MRLLTGGCVPCNSSPFIFSSAINRKGSTMRPRLTAYYLGVARSQHSSVDGIFKHLNVTAGLRNRLPTKNIQTTAMLWSEPDADET